MIWHDDRRRNLNLGVMSGQMVHRVLNAPAGLRQPYQRRVRDAAPYNLAQDGEPVLGAEGKKIYSAPAVIIPAQARMYPLWKFCHLMCSSFSTSFRLMVSIRLTPCSFVDAKPASLGTPAGGNSSPAPLRLLSPANPFHWASPGSAHTLRHRCGLPLLGVAVRRVRRHLMCNSFSTSFRLIVSIRLTPCSCMVTP